MKGQGDRMRKNSSDDEREWCLAEDLWLNYFNRYLFDHDTISEKEYKLMTEKIAARKAKRPHEREAR
jgi:hypothetical protein